MKTYSAEAAHAPEADTKPIHVTADSAFASPSNRDLAELRRAVQVLADGKWDRRDATAVVVILGALSGLVSAAVLVAQSLGLL